MPSNDRDGVAHALKRFILDVPAAAPRELPRAW
jgi:hypothetical protein